MGERLYIQTDASFSSADEKAGIAAVLIDPIRGSSLFALGATKQFEDNILAEYYAVLYALENIPAEHTSVVIFCDCQTVVDVLSGRKFPAGKHRYMVNMIKNRVQDAQLDVVFRWKRRNTIPTADAISVMAARRGNFQIRA